MKIDWQLFRFPLDDPRWKNKALIGGLLAFAGYYFSLPLFVLMLPLNGYGIRVMRHNAKGEPPALPEWDDWGGLFADGLRSWVVILVYNLPVFVLTSCSMLALIPSFLAIPAMSNEELTGIAIVSVMGSYAVFFVMMGIIMLISLPLNYLSLVAMTRMAVTSSLNSAFEFRNVWQLARKGFKNYIVAYLVYLGVLMGLSMIISISAYTVVLCCLYPFLLALLVVYSQVFMGTVFGMAYYHTNAELQSESSQERPPKLDRPSASDKDRPTPVPAPTAPLKEKPKKPRAASKKKDAE
ncbi:MAG: DUF4013 domain-containing protein [Anaerolineae bacterium]|nr:DUF4013 domain-containing protein [Anaerolineae bacterium]